MTETQSAPCPQCRELGRKVEPQTLVHLVDPAALRRSPGVTRFCASASCDVAYYGERGQTIEKDAVVVPIFQKETHPSRPICYCFEHTADAIVKAQQPDGSNTIVDAITRACRRRLDRCHETNPQGRCCLGNVRGLLRIPAAPCCGGEQ